MNLQTFSIEPDVLKKVKTSKNINLKANEIKKETLIYFACLSINILGIPILIFFFGTFTDKLKRNNCRIFFLNNTHEKQAATTGCAEHPVCVMWKVGAPATDGDGRRARTMV